MYIRHLRIRNLRLIRDLELSFVGDDGARRMWTVLIGRNGTGKTSILQAIALAAVGSLRANQLAGPTSVSMPDRRRPADLVIDATFEFGPLGDGQHRRRTYPNSHGRPKALHSKLFMPPGSADLEGRSFYQYGGDADLVAHDAPPTDPLQRARSDETPHWFVAGYGVSRHLVVGDTEKQVGKPSHDRLVPLFRPNPLIGIGFADRFAPKTARLFTKILRKVLKTAAELVPDIRDVETGGRGGVSKAADLYERDRFEQGLPDGSSIVTVHPRC